MSRVMYKRDQKRQLTFLSHQDDQALFLTFCRKCGGAYHESKARCDDYSEHLQTFDVHPTQLQSYTGAVHEIRNHVDYGLPPVVQDISGVSGTGNLSQGQADGRV